MSLEAILFHGLTVLPATIGAILAWWKAKDIHVIVNHQRDVMLEKIEKLEATIKDFELTLKK